MRIRVAWLGMAVVVGTALYAGVSCRMPESGAGIHVSKVFLPANSAETRTRSESASPASRARLPANSTEVRTLQAMRWVKAHQNPDGSWSESRPVGATGICLILFLWHGELANSKEFGETVQKATKYLADRFEQAPAGTVLENETSHAQAAWALVEAYGMTKLPFLKAPVEKALATIIQRQKPCGGWERGTTTEDKWDLMVSIWQIMALKAGYLAGSYNTVSLTALQKAQTFLQKTAYHDGFFRRSSAQLTEVHPGVLGAGVYGLCLFGYWDDAQATSAVKWLSKKGEIQWNDAKRTTMSFDDNFEPYDWYFQSWALFYNGKHWADWERLCSPVWGEQQFDGHWEMPPVATGGTVNFNGGEDAIPYYMTALVPMILGPIYSRFRRSSFKIDYSQAHGADATTLEVE